MLEKFKRFWNAFLEGIKTAYNQTLKKPISTEVQPWRDINKINFLDIFVSKLNNLTCNEATFDIESDSTQTDKLKILCKDIENKRFEITSGMLADGDFYCFPATDVNGNIIHTYLSQQQVRILELDGGNITEAYGIIDWYADKNNKIYYLLRHHKLDINGTLTVSHMSVDECGNHSKTDKWQDIDGSSYMFQNARHIGFGRYKSPASSRGLSPVYGVPLNFGCGEIEDKINMDLQLIDDEFKNAKSLIFTDPRNLLKDDEKKEYKIAENIIPIQYKAGLNGPNIEIFNPNIRYSEHYSKLVADMGLYEKQVGTSKGILTDNETAYTATATAVKRANSDTLSLVGKIRNAIDAGNEMTLRADAMYLNISNDLWSYKSDWYDPFTDPVEQWQMLLEAKNNGAAEAADLVRWQFPNLTQHEIDEKLQRISLDNKLTADDAIDRILMGR